MPRIACLVFALLFIFALPAAASPGGTDGNGGHIDAATGEYHFHHGFPAHEHINGVCPLDPNFTSNVITGQVEEKQYTGSEDRDDIVVTNLYSVSDDAFRGIQKSGQTGVIASGVVLTLIAVGGFLSTVKRCDRSGNACPPPNHSRKTIRSPGAWAPGRSDGKN
jgi:hypothetical protein